MEAYSTRDWQCFRACYIVVSGWSLPIEAFRIAEVKLGLWMDGPWMGKLRTIVHACHHDISFINTDDDDSSRVQAGYKSTSHPSVS